MPQTLPAHAPLRVLVVDDFFDGRSFVTEYLTYIGYEVFEAVDGAEALTIARREHPDVILMDLQMPVLNGWEATRQLKTDAATEHIVVVAMTAHSGQREIDLAYEAGSDAVVVKPFDISALAEALGRVQTTGPAAFAVPALNPRTSAATGRFSKRDSNQPTSPRRPLGRIGG